MRRNEIVDMIRNTLRQVAPNSQTILYGSEARGDARPDRDIDLLILVDEPQFTPEHRIALVQYRFERAYLTLKEADYMRKGDFFNAAINRLYYACFYAATGLLIAKGIDTGTHNGVKTMLSLFLKHH